jgi:serine/threonine-protein kinase SRPK3
MKEVTREDCHNLQMFDSFFHHGQNGKHCVIAFEVLGKNLLSLIRRHDYRGIPLPVVRRITKQLLIGLEYLHSVCRIIHTDLKPENCVFSLTERERFDLLHKYVLNSPLIEQFETEKPIILNSKQLKNQKKKERKKRKQT